jgi:hypothetical protein
MRLEQEKEKFTKLFQQFLSDQKKLNTRMSDYPANLSLGTRTEIDSKENLLINDDSKISQDTSQIKEETPVSKKYFFKKILLIGILNSCILFSAAINNISLENIGLKNIVYTSSILTIGEFIANTMIFFFITTMKRKKWLKIFNGVNLLLASVLFINSFFSISEHLKLFNMFFSFLMKIFIKMTAIITLLFAGKFPLIDS